MRAVFAKEIKAYINTLPAYMFAALTLMGGGASLAVTGAHDVSDSLRVTDSLQYMLFISVPLLTMRLGYGKYGIDRTLFSAPVGAPSIIAGKYFAALAVLAVSLAASLIYPLAVAAAGGGLPGETAAGYVGLLLLGAMLVAAGMFVSSFRLSRPAAGILTLALMLLILLFQAVIPGITAPWLKALMTKISPSYHMHVFGSGIISFSSAVYFITFSALLLYLAGGVVKHRRRS